MGGPRRSLDDRAVSDTIGVVLMVAISVAMAGGMYVWVFGFGTPGQPPPALGLTSSSPISNAGTKTFTVSSVQTDVLWNDLILKVDGASFAYDDGLGGSRKFCVAAESGTCIPDAAWQASATPVRAGHTLYVHDMDLVGKSLQVIDGPSGTMVLSIPIGVLVDD